MAVEVRFFLKLSSIDKNFNNLCFTGQTKVHYVGFNGSKFLIHYEGGRLWIEIYSEEENAENDYRVHAASVKYLLVSNTPYDHMFANMQ